MIKIMQQELEVKREESGKLKAIKKNKNSRDEVKHQEDNSSINSDKKKRGRPKKNSEISSQSGQKEGKNMSTRNKTNPSLPLNEAKLEEKQEQSKTIPEQQNKSKISQSNENDLCKALLLMKQTLPNRSLQKIIIKLYQSIQSQELVTSLANNNNKKDIRISQKNSNKGFQSNPTEKAVSLVSKIGYAFHNDQISNPSVRSADNDEENQINQSIEKLVVPGKKVSCYHDKAGQIAATSHQFYKNNLPTLQNLQNISKSINYNELIIKPHVQSIVDQQQLQNTEKIQMNHIQNKIFSFKQSLMLKTVFYNPIEQQKYKQRRLLAQLFVQRGYGITKTIDDELPPINIDRNRYKNLLGGILTMAFRKLESFIANQCNKSIKYIDREQMKSLSGMLLNCRFKLEPEACETYFKFLRVVFALGDVVISQREAIELYVNVSKYLYGKSITIDELQNMGKVKNRRTIYSTIQDLKKKIQLKKQKVSLMKVDQQQGASVQLFSQALNIEEKEQYIWTAALEAQFIHLYTKQQNLYIIQEILGEKYAQFDNYMISQYEKKLKDLILLGLVKLRKQSMVLNSDLRLCDLQESTQNLINVSNEGGKIRCWILNYLMGTQKCPLELIISEINDFVDKKALQNVINDIQIEFSQLGNQSISFFNKQQNELIEFDNGSDRNEMANENQNEHIISQLFF